MEYKHQLSGLKVAIVHDWLIGLGGGERVVESLIKLFPQAELYTSVYDPDKIKIFKKYQVHTTFLQHWPLAKSKHQLFAGLRPLAFESLDLSDYNLVISSCSAESKGVITPTETLHISYIHTPIRYYWGGYNDYLAEPGLGVLNPLVRVVLPMMIKKLRKWDYAAAQRPDYLIANSKTVSLRINKYYDRASKVITPPVSIDRFTSMPQASKPYYLVISRLVPYKRVDLAIAACNELGLDLIVAGRGPESKRLKKMAGKTIKFIDSPSDKDIERLYGEAKALIFSAEEDFGITPVEAMASGTPVICYGKGGATETVIDGVSGVYHPEQTVQSLIVAIQKFSSMSFDKADMQNRAEDFSEQRFKNEFGGFVLEKINNI